MMNQVSLPWSHSAHSLRCLALQLWSAMQRHLIQKPVQTNRKTRAVEQCGASLQRHVHLKDGYPFYVPLTC